MSLVTTLFLLLLAVHPVLKQDHQKDVAIARRMLEREVYLHQEMIRLLQETEESMEEATFLSPLQWLCLFWTAVAALVLLTLACWLSRRGMHHESPRSVTACCSGLPPDVSEFEIRLILDDHNASGT